jgi:hypothetical protein
MYKKMTPTETSVKLAIAQVLSMPSVFNAPLYVLDFNIDEKGTVSGRFRDAARPRVFSYEIADDGITFSPFVPGRMDSGDWKVEDWEKFSDGYSFRIDAGMQKRTDKPKCNPAVSFSCGKACVSLKKKCKTDPQDPTSVAKKEKLKAVIKEVTVTDKTSKIKVSKDKSSKPKANKLIDDLEPLEPLNTSRTPTETVLPELISNNVVKGLGGKVGRGKYSGSAGGDYEDTGKMMNYPLKSVVATKDMKGKEKEVADAAKMLKESERNWLPVYVKEVRPYEYEVVGNHLTHAAAIKAGFERIWTIPVDSDPATLKQIQMLTNGN